MLTLLSVSYMGLFILKNSSIFDYISQWVDMSVWSLLHAWPHIGIIFTINVNSLNYLETVSCSQGWLWNCFVSKSNFEPLSDSSAASSFWDYCSRKNYPGLHAWQASALPAELQLCLQHWDCILCRLILVSCIPLNIIGLCPNLS